MPPSEIARGVEKLSLEINKKEEAYFVLDSKSFYPHITIYGVEFPTRNLEKVFSEVESLAKKLVGVKFTFQKVATEKGYIGIECDCTEEFRAAHETIIEKLNPLRDGHIREKDNQKSSEFSEKEENIQKYGHPEVMNLYKPHVTVIRLKDERVAEKTAAEIKWPVKEFVLDRIGIFKMGENGTCIELLKEFKLGE